MGWGYYAPYVPVGAKKAAAKKKIEQLRKQDSNIAPVVVAGRKITTTWWGNAWCDNLKRYATFENRIERGSAYVRNGFVIDLRIDEGSVAAQVMGSELYRIDITIDRLPDAKWRKIVDSCAQRVKDIGALVEGKFPSELADVFMKQGDGLFPAPEEIHMSCSCPDWVEMCKHIAAALYGVGARLDSDPLLFFKLRGVDPGELIRKSFEEKMRNLLANAGRKSERVISDEDAARLFGI